MIEKEQPLLSRKIANDETEIGFGFAFGAAAEAGFLGWRTPSAVIGACAAGVG